MYKYEGKFDNHILLGKVLENVEVAQDGYSVLFKIKDEKDILAEAYAECCSHTWVQDVELPALGFPALVTSVEDLDMPDPEDYNKKNFDSLSFYGLKINTDKGEIVIDYRNDSNGYYGGDLTFPRRTGA